MKYRTHLALFATLVAGTAMAQDVAVSTTTIAQSWKQETPGFSKATMVPATEFVAIDVPRMDGKGALSMHLYGWGMADFGDASTIGGKNAGDLTYGYLQYDFAQANGQIKAGRLVVNQGIGPVQVDGAEVRTDLRGGFTVAAFAGAPVIYKNYSNNLQDNVAYQRNFIYGGRLGWRAGKLGEIGVAYLQDGGTPAKKLSQPVDYTRRQVAADISLAPWEPFDLSGHTVWNVAKDQITPAGADLSRIAEHDYKTTIRLAPTIALTGTFVERNLFAYFAGTTLPSLFNQQDQGAFRATGASLAWQAVPSLQVVADVRRSNRAFYGTSTRAGAELRGKFSEGHLQAGCGYHKVNAFTVPTLQASVPAYSLSHNELRAWVMASHDKLSASLDAIRIGYDAANANPNLMGHSLESAVTGSLGYQAKDTLKVSGDLSVENNALYQKQVTGLVRVQYQFGLGAKGGK